MWVSHCVDVGLWFVMWRGWCGVFHPLLINLWNFEAAFASDVPILFIDLLELHQPRLWVAYRLLLHSTLQACGAEGTRAASLARSSVAGCMYGSVASGGFGANGHPAGTASREWISAQSRVRWQWTLC